MSLLHKKLSLRDLIQLEDNLDNYDPQLVISFISSKDPILDKKLKNKFWDNFYLIPTIKENINDDDIRVDLCPNETMHQRINKPQGNPEMCNGYFILVPKNKTIDDTTFILEDSDNGLEVLLDETKINKELESLIDTSMRKRNHIYVNIKIRSPIDPITIQKAFDKATKRTATKFENVSDINKFLGGKINKKYKTKNIYNQKKRKCKRKTIKKI